MCQSATPESIPQVLLKSNHGDQQALGALMPPAYGDVQGLLPATTCQGSARATRCEP
jgi:hypothetical protein